MAKQRMKQGDSLGVATQMTKHLNGCMQLLLQCAVSKRRTFFQQYQTGVIYQDSNIIYSVSLTLDLLPTWQHGSTQLHP
jgi:hypothetical protein